MKELCHLLWVPFTVRCESCQIGLTWSFCPQTETQGGGSQILFVPFYLVAISFQSLVLSSAMFLPVFLPLLQSSPAKLGLQCTCCRGEHKARLLNDANSRAAQGERFTWGWDNWGEPSGGRKTQGGLWTIRSNLDGWRRWESTTRKGKWVNQCNL